MPRKLKAWQVDEVKFRDNSAVPLMLNRGTNEFYCDVFGICVEAKSAQECRIKACAEWDRRAQIDWKKVIIATLKEESYTDGRGIRCSHHTVEIGKSPDGKWIQKDKGIRGENWVNPYYGATETEEVKGIYVLPWSEATDAALVDIESRIEELKRRLKELLVRPDAPTVLASMVGKLLPGMKKGE